MDNGTTTQISHKSKWRYAFSQYIKFLLRVGGKFVYLVQWSAFNFGFHVIVAWGR